MRVIIFVYRPEAVDIEQLKILGDAIEAANKKIFGPLDNPVLTVNEAHVMYAAHHDSNADPLYILEVK